MPAHNLTELTDADKRHLMMAIIVAPQLQALPPHIHSPAAVDRIITRASTLVDAILKSKPT